MPTLTPSQVTQYYATEGKKAAPLSPLDWLARQTPSVAPTTVGASGVSVPAPKLAEKPMITAKPADPIIAGSPVRRYTAPASGTYASEAETYFKGLQANAPVTDENKIREEMLKNVQAQIDAIRNTAALAITREQERGQGRLGETRAIAARSGLVGSDFGAAQKDKTMQLNEESVRAIEAERDLQITGILAKVNSEAYDRASKAREEASSNAKDYLNFLKGRQEEARTDVVTLAKSGVSIEDLTDEEYTRLLDASGLSEDELKAQFTINKPEDKVLTSFTEGNKYYVVTQDPITGKKKTESVDLGFDVPPGYKAQNIGDGTMLFYPEKFDPDKPIKDQILTYGVGKKSDSSGEKATKSGTLVYTAQDRTDDSQQLEASRGTDGWVDPTLYQTLYQAWVGAGGVLGDFLKEFPPNQYVNPANDWLPAFLRNTKTKTTTPTAADDESPY